MFITLYYICNTLSTKKNLLLNGKEICRLKVFIILFFLFMYVQLILLFRVLKNRTKLLKNFHVHFAKFFQFSLYCYLYFKTSDKFYEQFIIR